MFCVLGQTTSPPVKDRLRVESSGSRNDTYNADGGTPWPGLRPAAMGQAALWAERTGDPKASRSCDSTRFHRERMMFGI
jgi:hypothetical protein